MRMHAFLVHAGSGVPTASQWSPRDLCAGPTWATATHDTDNTIPAMYSSLQPTQPTAQQMHAAAATDTADQVLDGGNHILH